MTALNDAREFLIAISFLVELISQLFHTDVLTTEQAERIDSARTRLSGCGPRWPGRAAG
jgi:hypothetical protein